MKTLALVALVLAGCSKSDPLKADLERFCSSALAGKSPAEFGPTLEAAAKSDQFKALLAQLKGGSISIPQWLTTLDGLAKKVGIEKCAAVDAMNQPKAAPAPAAGSN